MLIEQQYLAVVPEVADLEALRNSSGSSNLFLYTINSFLLTSICILQFSPYLLQTECFLKKSVLIFLIYATYLFRSTQPTFSCQICGVRVRGFARRPLVGDIDFKSSLCGRTKRKAMETRRLFPSFSTQYSSSYLPWGSPSVVNTILLQFLPVPTSTPSLTITLSRIKLLIHNHPFLPKWHKVQSIPINSLPPSSLPRACTVMCTRPSTPKVKA